MAVVAYLLEKLEYPGEQLVNGVRAMVLGIDTAVDTTDALRRARGDTVARAKGHAVPTGYFDAVPRAIVTTWDAAGDVSIFSGRKPTETIA